jgi:hypothetical protein
MSQEEIQETIPEVVEKTTPEVVAPAETPVESATTDAKASTEASSESQTEPSERDKLIANMTQGTWDKLPTSVADQKEAAANEPEEEVEPAADPEKVVAENKNDEESEPDFAAPLTDADLGDKTRTKKRFDQLRDAAAFGHLIQTVAERGKIPPQEFANWVSIRVGLAAGDPRAIEAIGQLAEKAGYKGKAAAVPDKAEADRIYEEVFKADVDAGNADEATSKRQAVQVDPLTDVASARVRQLDAEYGKAIPEWQGNIRAKVYDRIAKEHAGAHPVDWVPIMQRIATEEQAKIRKPAAAPAAKITPSIRSATTGTSKAGIPKAGTKSAIVHALVSGTL